MNAEAEKTAPLQYSDVRPSDKLIADDGFDCIGAGSLLTVRATELGSLYVRCKCGKHFLDGQEGDDGELIGFKLAIAKASQP